MFTYLCINKKFNIMEQSTKIANRNSIIFALIYGATYIPAVWALKYHIFGQPISIIVGR